MRLVTALLTSLIVESVSRLLVASVVLLTLLVFSPQSTVEVIELR